MPTACSLWQERSHSFELNRIKARTKVPFEALPELSAEEMALVLRNADCLFARPGAGMTTEAIACGTPVVFDLSQRNDASGVQ